MSGRIDPATLIQVVLPLVALAVVWGANTARLDAQAETLRELGRAIENERAERLAYQASQAQARIAWLMARAGQRLDPDLKAVVRTASETTP